MTVELYRVHRPVDFDSMVGQDDVVDMVESMIDNERIPHCILATGPSGTGKTTLLRILKGVLDCSDMDFKEINAADFRGIDMVRDIRQSIGLSPINGHSKIWLIDECHQLTSQAQESLLKLLEDTPRHAYFFLASTDPQKLKNTIITRSTHLKFKSIDKECLRVLVSAVYKKETKKELSDKVAKKIATVAEGSARKALVLLHQIIDLDISDEDKIGLIESSSARHQSIEICRMLLNRKGNWSAMAEILREVGEDPEQIRWMVLGYMKNVALKGSGIAGRAVEIIEEFEDNFYDSKHAGLVRACFNCMKD